MGCNDGSFCFIIFVLPDFLFLIDTHGNPPAEGVQERAEKDNHRECQVWEGWVYIPKDEGGSTGKADDDIVEKSALFHTKPEQQGLRPM